MKLDILYWWPIMFIQTVKTSASYSGTVLAVNLSLVPWINAYFLKSKNHSKKRYLGRQKKITNNYTLLVLVSFVFIWSKSIRSTPFVCANWKFMILFHFCSFFSLPFSPIFLRNIFTTEIVTAQENLLFECLSKV